MALRLDVPSPNGVLRREVNNMIRRQRVLDLMKPDQEEAVPLTVISKGEDIECGKKNRKVAVANDEAEFIQNNFFDKAPIVHSENGAASTSNGPSASNSTDQTQYNGASAFGKIKFTGRRRTTARFLRFAYDGSDEAKDAPKLAYQLLVDYWGATKPTLVLSVIGTYHDSIKISKEDQRKIIRDSIMNVIDSIDGWVITAGNNSGIAQAFASAVAERQEIRLRKGEKKQIICIGITPWGNIQYRDAVANKVKEERKMGKLYPVIPYNSEVPKTRTRKESNMQVDHSYLNPKHTHFLLPDNYFENEEAEVAAIKFRTALEKEIASLSQTTLITLLLEGCLTTVDLAYETIERDGSLFVINNTGTLAKIIAQHKKHFDDHGHIDKEILQKEVEKTFFKMERNEEQEACLDIVVTKITKICKSNNVTIISPGYVPFGSRDLDIPILQKLVEVNAKQEGWVENQSILEYAMRLDRIDIAQEIVKKAEFDVDREDLVFLHAIKNDMVHFVKLLVKYGMDVDRFLKKDTLETLYKITDPLHLQQILPSKKKRKKEEEEEKPYLSGVEKFLIQTTNCSARYSKCKDFKDPFHELMIYAAFFNRMELADYFWRQTDRPLLSALVAAWLAQILKKCFQKRFNDELTKCYRDMKCAFEEKAIKLLDIAWNSHQGWARDLVMSTGRPQWSHLTLIEIAAEGRLQAFLGHSACQKEIFQKWTQGYDCNRKKYLFSFLFIIPMFFNFFVRFERDTEKEKEYVKSTCFGKETSPISSATLPQTPSA